MYIKIKNYPSKDGKIGGRNIRGSYVNQDEIDENWKNALPPDWKPFWERKNDKPDKEQNNT